MRKMIGLMVCGMGLAVMGQTATPGGEGGKKVVVSEMKVENLQGFTFLHLKQTTTVQGMVEHLGKDVQAMTAVMKEKQISAHGPLVIVMHGVNADPEHSFEVEAGFKVEAGTVAPAGYAVQELGESKSAVVLYSGPLMQVREAYERLFAGLGGAGLTPTDEVREYLLYYEGVDSINNVAMAAVGVK
ncbi:MAG TPA: GyrI-like domain-containing protein [Tepidisphaeraceae bacterium]|jgi:predicted transcriptional regulator YdeE|nr:GyrI-like domain-containing protein [Tepidisphaeraceae bacterium]